jgi:hypothetical protein
MGMRSCSGLNTIAAVLWRHVTRSTGLDLAVVNQRRECLLGVKVHPLAWFCTLLTQALAVTLIGVVCL